MGVCCSECRIKYCEKYLVKRMMPNSLLFPCVCLITKTNYVKQHKSNCEIKKSDKSNTLKQDLFGRSHIASVKPEKQMAIKKTKKK